MTAPENFSLIHNTDEVLEFFGNIREIVASNAEPLLDMREVKSLGPDGIAMLNAVMASLAREGIGVSGTMPHSPDLADVLRRSGFFEHVRPPRGTSYHADRGIVIHEGQQIVDTELAQQLVEFGMSRLYGAGPSRHQATYAAIGEFMQNTYDHAGGARRGKTRWWASVYFDQENGVVHFTFLDMGVGVFGSRPVGVFDTFRRYAGDTEFLKELFAGRIASRTGIQWRGQGLPRINRRVKRRDLTEMTVITNRVKGHLDSDTFVPLQHNFEGTLYHWEMRRP